MSSLALDGYPQGSGGSLGPLGWQDVVHGHGAVGDGVTDDSAAINAAIAALPATGGIVYFPPPPVFYYIRSGIVDPGIPNVTLLGIDGASFGVSGSVGTSTESVSPCAIGSDQAIVLLTIGSASSTDWRGWRVVNLGFFDCSASNNTVVGGVLLQRRDFVKLEGVHIFDITAGYGIQQSGNAGNPQYTDLEGVKVYNCLNGLVQATKASDTHIRRSTFYGINVGNAVRGGSIGLDIDSSTTMDEESSVQFYETAIRIGGVGGSQGRCNRINGHIEASSGFPGLVGVSIVAGNDNLINCRIANTWSTAKILIASGVLRTGITNLVTESDDLTAGNTIVDNSVSDATYSTYKMGALTGLDLGQNAFATGIRTITGNKTLANRDHIVLCNATSAAFTVTLPSAVNCSGRHYLLKLINTNFKTVTVATTSAQTIEGLASVVLKLPQDYIEVQSDGANWRVVGAISPVSTLFAPQIPNLVGPDPREGTVNAIAVSAINAARAYRNIVPKSGELMDLAIYVVVSSGNIDVGVFDTSVTTRNKLFSTGSIACPSLNAWAIVGMPSSVATTVNGNQTVGAGAALTVASTTGFDAVGSIVVNGVKYAYTAKTATTFTLTAGGTFTDTQAVTQGGLTVRRGDNLDFLVSADNTTATFGSKSIQSASSQLPSVFWPSPLGGKPWTNYLVTGVFPLASFAESSMAASSSGPGIIARIV